MTIAKCKIDVRTAFNATGFLFTEAISTVLVNVVEQLKKEIVQSVDQGLVGHSIGCYLTTVWPQIWMVQDLRRGQTPPITSETGIYVI